MLEMARASRESIKDAIVSLHVYSDELAERIQKKEDLTDHYEDIIGTYLVKLSSMKIAEEESMRAGEYLKMITDLERIADHSVSIMKSSAEMKEKGILFSAAAGNEMEVMCRAINEICELAYNAFAQESLDDAFMVEPLEQVVDYLKDVIRTNHIKRLQAGGCSIEAGFILSDILTSMERVSDHCSNIAGCIIDASSNNLNVHETLNEYKHNSERFNRAYTRFMEKYSL